MPFCCQGVAPFPGATTGTGGRIRDVQATGRGAHVIAGTAGYCFGNLHIPGDSTFCLHLKNTDSNTALFLVSLFILCIFMPLLPTTANVLRLAIHPLSVR